MSKSILKSHYNYNEKYKLPVLVPPSAVEELESMDVRPDDIFICTHPKSGTHWMQEIVQLILHDGDSTKLSHNNRRVVMEAIDTTDVDPGCIATGTPNFKLMAEDPSPRVFTTHLRKDFLPKQIWTRSCPIIYVHRHPKDVITSWFEYYFKIARLFDPSVESLDKTSKTVLFEEFFKTRLQGNHEYDAWFDHVLEYDSLKNGQKILYVTYEEMKANLKEVVERVAKFIGRALPDEALEKVVKNATFTTMKKNFNELEEQSASKDDHHIDVRIFIGKGTSGRWKNYFSVRQSEEFDEIYHSKMKDCSITKVHDI